MNKRYWHKQFVVKDKNPIVPIYSHNACRLFVIFIFAINLYYRFWKNKSIAKDVRIRNRIFKEMDNKGMVDGIELPNFTYKHI